MLPGAVCTFRFPWFCFNEHWLVKWDPANFTHFGYRLQKLCPCPNCWHLWHYVTPVLRVYCSHMTPIFFKPVTFVISFRFASFAWERVACCDFLVFISKISTGSILLLSLMFLTRTSGLKPVAAYITTSLTRWSFRANVWWSTFFVAKSASTFCWSFEVLCKFVSA